MKFSQKSEYIWTFVVQLFFLYQTMSGDGGDGLKNRRRNEKNIQNVWNWSDFQEDWTHMAPILARFVTHGLLILELCTFPCN